MHHESIRLNWSKSQNKTVTDFETEHFHFFWCDLVIFYKKPRSKAQPLRWFRTSVNLFLNCCSICSHKSFRLIEKYENTFPRDHVPVVTVLKSDLLANTNGLTRTLVCYLCTGASLSNCVVFGFRSLCIQKRITWCVKGDWTFHWTPETDLITEWVCKRTGLVCRIMFRVQGEIWFGMKKMCEHRMIKCNVANTVHLSTGRGFVFRIRATWTNATLAILGYFFSWTSYFGICAIWET